jgi:hypothetical protein
VQLSAWNLRLCANTEFSLSLTRASVVFFVLADVANDNEALRGKANLHRTRNELNKWNQCRV